MNINRKVSAVVLFLGLVLAGYIGVQYFNPALLADQKDNKNPVRRYYEHQADFAQEEHKPRFSGEIGGIFLASEGTPIPEKYSQGKTICNEQKSWIVSDDQAGVLSLDLQLPEEFVLDTESLNTGTVACDGGVTVSRKSYLYYWPNGDTGDIVIGRSFLTYDEQSVASDRVRAQKIAGRDVVIINTVTEYGYWDHAYAYFPEPFGVTFIQAFSLPRSEFMKLVELVASSTRSQ